MTTEHATIEEYLRVLRLVAAEPELEAGLPPPRGDGEAASTAGRGEAEKKIRLPPPMELVPLTLTNLEGCLADPEILVIRSDGETVTGPADLVGNWMVFALWLRQVPAGVVPADFQSRAARYRFLVWTLLVRRGWPEELDPQQRFFCGQPVPLGKDEVLAEARLARSDWLEHLQNWEDDRWLSTRHTADPEAIERDLRWLTSTWVGADERPFSLDPPTSHDPAVEVDHETIARRVSEQHWLPRGALYGAARAHFPASGWRFVVPVAGPLMACVPLAVLLVGCAAASRWVAVALVAIAALGAWLLPPSRAALALARLPAAIAVGEAVLLSLTARWWQSPDAGLVGVGALALAWGYLCYDSRAHGSSRRLAFGRGSALWLTGALYAATISIAVLGFVTPAVADSGGCLEGWWAQGAFAPRIPSGVCATKLNITPGTRLPPVAEVLMFMSGWSLGTGLLAQILWDDRPVSAPLGRVRRTKGPS